MKDRVRNLGVGILISIGIASIFLLTGAMLWGIPRLSTIIYRYANPISGSAFTIDLVLLPFAIFKRLRPWIGFVIFWTSYLFGLVLWLFAAIVTYEYFGYFGLFFGLIWLGVGVVPIALVAAAVRFYWSLLAILARQMILVIGARLLGLFLMKSKPTVSTDEYVLDNI